jgi:phytoene dehydrogenase-like protein
MSFRVAVIGAGMGGLAASCRLAGLGYDVTLFEARAGTGGLASTFEAGGLSFDSGPYVLLDRPGLTWAFDKIGLDLDAEVKLLRFDPAYEVRFRDGRPLRFHVDLEATVAEIEERWTGAGPRYRDLVTRGEEIYSRIAPLQRVSRPGLLALLAHGIWRDVLFLTRSLDSSLRSAGLPEPLRRAIGIWTHIAGQPMDEAPSPMALVPALVHRFGAFYPSRGIGTLPVVLERRARECGVRIQLRTKVSHLGFAGSRPKVGIGSDELEFDAVVSDAGLATYLTLARDFPDRARRRLDSLPLQSPGVCAYLRLQGAPSASYLTFQLDSESSCRLLARPGAAGNGWQPARLLAPCALQDSDEQNRYLDELLDEDWWKESVNDFEILGRRVPSSWGREFHLYRDAMNPVMTARFMRRGRLSHRSPYARGLYLAGSATHPGQWVSFCAISGVLAAEALHEDRRSCS